MKQMVRLVLHTTGNKADSQDAMGNATDITEKNNLQLLALPTSRGERAYLLWCSMPCKIATMVANRLVPNVAPHEFATATMNILIANSQSY